MVIQDLTKVVIRLFAIYLAMSGLALFPHSLSFAAMGASDAPISLYLFLVAPISYWVIAVLFWVLSSPVARIVASDRHTEETQTSIDITVLERAGFSIVGVYILSWSIPELIRVVFVSFEDVTLPIFNITRQNFWDDIATLISFVLGFFLVFGARGLQGFVARIRSYGT